MIPNPRLVRPRSPRSTSPEGSHNRDLAGRGPTWFGSPRTWWILALIALVSLGLATGSAAVLEPEILRWEWAESPRSRSTDWCPEGKICIEWCRVYKGQIPEGTGRLCCGTEEMIGTHDPSCPD